MPTYTKTFGVGGAGTDSGYVYNSAGFYAIATIAGGGQPSAYFDGASLVIRGWWELDLNLNTWLAGYIPGTPFTSGTLQFSLSNNSGQAVKFGIGVASGNFSAQPLYTAANVSSDTVTFVGTGAQAYTMGRDTLANLSAATLAALSGLSGLAKCIIGWRLVNEAAASSILANSGVAAVLTLNTDPVIAANPQPAIVTPIRNPYMRKF